VTRERIKAGPLADGQKEFSRAKETAYRLLTYRARSRKELETKLLEKQFSLDTVRDVLEELVRFGYINDEAFALQWSSSRFRSRGFGERRIRQELRQKGINPDLINSTLSAVLSQEMQFQTALMYADKKLDTLKNTDRETRRRRVAAFLERKGFTGDIISQIVKKIES